MERMDPGRIVNGDLAAALFRMTSLGPELAAQMGEEAGPATSRPAPYLFHSSAKTDFALGPIRDETAYAAVNTHNPPKWNVRYSVL